MGFRRQDLQEAFFVLGSHAFRVYGYGTADPLEAVLEVGNFDAARAQLRPGELIFVNAGDADGHGNRASAAASALRAALVMVAENARGVPLRARLVQDFGGPAAEPDGSADPTQSGPPKRGRGRPPGSRTQQPA